MEVLNSYTAAFRSCLERQSFCIARLTQLSKNMNIDTSGSYKIIYVQSSNKNFCIGNQVYPCQPGDVFLTTPHDWHYFSDYSIEDDHSRIIFFIHPQYLRALSTPETDLCSCFQEAAAKQNYKVPFSSNDQLRFQNFITKLLHTDVWGYDLLAKCYLTELCILINHLYLEHAPVLNTQTPYSSTNSAIVQQIMSYIDQHICEPLTSNSLAERFFLSPSYLCRIFKNTTGTTPHKYITAQRITLAKELLSAGASVSEVCLACGFNDYSHFIKIFTTSVGISPKKYAKLC